MTRTLLATLALSLAACSSADIPADSGVFSPVDLQRGLLTRAEATDFEETSSYEDIVDFLATMDGLSDQIYTTTFGTSVEGRDQSPEPHETGHAAVVVGAAALMARAMARERRSSPY